MFTDREKNLNFVLFIITVTEFGHEIRLHIRLIANIRKHVDSRCT